MEANLNPTTVTEVTQILAVGPEKQTNKKQISISPVPFIPGEMAQVLNKRQEPSPD